MKNDNLEDERILPADEAQGGRSMVEMLGVLAIIGVLSVGGIAGYSKAMYRYRLNKTIEEITYTAGAVRSFFAPQKSYKGLDNNADGRNLLKKANLIPDEMWKEGTSPTAGTYYIEHPFDSGVDLHRYPKIYSPSCQNDSLCNNQAFTMRLYDIPLEACVDLLTQDWSELNVTTFAVSNEGHAQTTNNYHLATPVNMNDAVKVCHSDDGFTQINLYYDFDITRGNWGTLIARTRSTLDEM